MRWLFGAVMVALIPTVAAAHDLGAECAIEGDFVRVTAYYDDNVAAADASVVVFDDSRQEIDKGKTDDKGTWTFSRPAAGKYWVVIDAGQGHRKNVRLTIPADPHGKAVTTEPSRAEFTRSRWPELILGLAIIAVGGLGLSWFLRNRSRRALSQQS